MENFKFERNSSILKLSVLCNILPYFGYLHQWKEVLELMSVKTKQLWIDNKEIFMFLGRKWKKHIKVFYWDDKVYIPRNAELYAFKTNWFHYIYSNSLYYSDVHLWRLDKLIVPILNQLNTNRSIVIDEDKEGFQKISFITINEALEATTSINCTSCSSNIQKFSPIFYVDLWRHISKMIGIKRVILKKLKEDFIEVNSVIPNPEWVVQNYNILNQDNKENFNEYFLWPVNNWICKPVSLCLNSDFSSRRCFEGFEDINVAKKEQIISISELKNIKWLNVVRMLNNFSNLESISTILEKFPNLKIKFDFNHKSKYSTHLLINTKQIICIFEGKVWNFRSYNGGLINCFWRFADIVWEEEWFIFKIDSFKWDDITLNLNYWEDSKKLPIIDKLKINTKFNNNLYIIPDESSLNLRVLLTKTKELAFIFKHWKSIIIEVDLLESDLKQIVYDISRLPNDHHYKLILPKSWKLIHSDVFNEIESYIDYIKINGYPLLIRIKKSTKSKEDLSQKRKFIVYDFNKNKSLTVDIYQLREMVP